MFEEHDQGNVFWCQGASGYGVWFTFEIGETTCSTCLVNLMKAGAQAQERLAVVGH